MRTDIQARRLELSPTLSDGIEERLDHLAERYNFLREATVVLSKQRNWFRAEVTLHIKHQMLRAEEQSNDLGSCIDSALDKLERQLRRHKGRLLHRSHAADQTEPEPLVEFEPDSPEEEYEAPRVVRVKRIPVKPMAIEEAALQMELLGHDFYVFRNDESNDLNVVYRRRNGDIGLIEPE